MTKSPKGVTIPTLSCQQCGHEWSPSVSAPKVCPRCKSYKWNEPKAEKEAAAS